MKAKSYKLVNLYKLEISLKYFCIKITIKYPYTVQAYMKSNAQYINLVIQNKFNFYTDRFNNVKH
jgi:hypothetical protein